MTYDDTAKKLGIKIIGTVESNLDYTAINFNDPITVGVAQWFGTRAAAVLERMRTTNAAAWYGVAASLNNQLASIPQTDAYWNSRFLTGTEGASLVGVLNRNQVIQNNQLIEDMEAYKAVAISYGFDPDANTETVLYFFAMHHQSPASALEVVETLDTTATLAQIHAATLAHPVLGQYGARYNTVYNLIVEANIDGVDPVPDPPAPDPVPINGNAKHIQVQADLLMVQFGDGERIPYVPTGRGQYLPGKKGAVPPPEPTPTQPPPPADNGDWFHPLPGSSITSPYGPRGWDGVGSFHWGVDFSTTTAATGGDVIAVTDMVVSVAYNAGTGGNATAGGYVKAHTLDGAYTFNHYHMAPGSVVPSAGDTITAGSVIGVEGQTGNVTGTHLHFEAYEGSLTDPWPPPYGNPIDPLPILRAHGVSV